MNERILEIAKQSGLWFVSSREDLMGDFAVLIVQECAKSADDWYQNHNDIHWDPAQHIKNHFGVES